MLSAELIVNWLLEGIKVAIYIGPDLHVVPLFSVRHITSLSVRHGTAAVYLISSRSYYSRLCSRLSTADVIFMS